MKTFVICFVALFAVAFGRSVIDDYEYVNGKYGFDGNEPNFSDGIERIYDKIIGGQETTIEQHPHQISLRKGGQHQCGGSIISPIRALTAAHCLENAPPSLTSIQAGSARRMGDAKAQLRSLSRFLLHPRWNTPRYAHDIGILYWQKPLIFGANVRPIRNPAANAAVPYGQESTSSGWGSTEFEGPPSKILKVVTLPLVSDSDCIKVFGEMITPDMVCSGGVEGRGACQGDSGGPLVHNNTLIGITSWGRKCATQGFPNVHSRVAFFIDWINQNIN